MAFEGHGWQYRIGLMIDYAMLGRSVCFHVEKLSRDTLLYEPE